jgi:photosystem I P700 chlorophyll a apoprotein A2
MYRTNFGIGHSMREILDAHTPPANGLGNGHKGYTTLSIIHYFSAWSSVSFRYGTICSLVAQHVQLTTLCFLAQDFTTQASLYTHHQYIAGFILCGLCTQTISLFVTMTLKLIRNVF